MAIFDGVRKGDVALAAATTTLGVLQMTENILAGPTTDVRIDPTRGCWCPPSRP